MSFGIYIHIPYCIQRCTYCDFATYEQSKIMPPSDYVEILKKEISFKKIFFQKPAQSVVDLDTVYFGGGTPSLLPASLITNILDTLNVEGFRRKSSCETTIEINPATVSEDKLKVYMDHGINRFSVGAQTFDDQLLKMVHREHNAKQTLQTLELLQKYNLNFNFDLLFALPNQSLEGFQRDVDIAVNIGASHISPYCLTVPTGHLLSKNRPMDEVQIEMFEYLHQKLTQNQFQQYEISNYAKPGFESRHNLLYWQDQNYWGLGLSAHSYLKNPDWGYRFWSVKNIDDFAAQLAALELPIKEEVTGPISAATFSGKNGFHDKNNNPCFEKLTQADSLTDFCHTALRLSSGLEASAVQKKFDAATVQKVTARLEKPIQRGFVDFKSGAWTLTRQGIHLSNQVFEEIFFSDSDISS